MIRLIAVLGMIFSFVVTCHSESLFYMIGAGNNTLLNDIEHVGNNDYQKKSGFDLYIRVMRHCPELHSNASLGLETGYMFLYSYSYDLGWFKDDYSVYSIPVIIVGKYKFLEIKQHSLGICGGAGCYFAMSADKSLNIYTANAASEKNETNAHFACFISPEYMYSINSTLDLNISVKYSRIYANQQLGFIGVNAGLTFK